MALKYKVFDRSVFQMAITYFENATSKVLTAVNLLIFSTTTSNYEKYEFSNIFSARSYSLTDEVKGSKLSPIKCLNQLPLRT